MGVNSLVFAPKGFRALSTYFKKQIMNFSSTAVKQNEDKAPQSEEDVIVKCLSGGKALITLNRPKQLNTLNFSMVTKIRKTLLQWEGDKYLILLKGSGEKAFCAGGDVVSVVKDRLGTEGKKFFNEEYKLDAYISCLQIPFISFITGIVMGGGVGISLFGKYRIATETSLFAMPETQIGFFPDVGVSYRLSRMPDQLGQFLGLTGYRLKGYDLVHAGIATHFCSSKNLPSLEEALLCDFSKDCCSCPDDILNEFHNKSLRDFNSCPPKFTLEPHLDCISTWFCEENLESVFRKIESDKSRFATDTKEVLSKMSPLSLKVTFRQIRNAANLEKFECFNVDYRIALKMITRGDFAEGVRALLVDKDKKPKWKHEHISKVTEEEISEYFCALPDNEELNLPDSMHDPSPV